MSPPNKTAILHRMKQIADELRPLRAGYAQLQEERELLELAEEEEVKRRKEAKKERDCTVERPDQYLFAYKTGRLPWPELKERFEELDRRRADLWGALVRYPRLRRPILQLVFAGGDDGPPPRALCKLAGMAPLLKRDAPLVEALLDADSTRDELLRVLGLVERFAAGERAFGSLRLPRPNEKGFAKYMAQVKASAKALNDLRGEMVARNIGLAVRFARQMCGSQLGFTDLMNEAAIAMYRAVDKFDVTRGFRFSTYATWWVKQGIRRARQDKEHTIRRPVHLQEKIRKVRRLRATQDIPQIAATLGINESVVRSVVEDIPRLTPLSMDGPQPGGYGALADAVPDASPNPEELALESAQMDMVRSLIHRLEGREKKIIMLRFGFDGPSQTLAEIGEIMGVSRERVRQLQVKALSELRVIIEKAQRDQRRRPGPRPAAHPTATPAPKNKPSYTPPDRILAVRMLLVFSGGGNWDLTALRGALGADGLEAACDFLCERGLVALEGPLHYSIQAALPFERVHLEVLRTLALYPRLTKRRVAYVAGLHASVANKALDQLRLAGIVIPLPRRHVGLYEDLAVEDLLHPIDHDHQTTSNPEDAVDAAANRHAGSGARPPRAAAQGTGEPPSEAVA